jgi:malate permease and related proteins
LNVFFSVLTQNILPIMLVASFGFFLRRRYGLHIGTLTSLVFNVLSPCLVFSSLVNSRLPAEELMQMVAFSFISILLIGGLAFGLTRLLRLGRVETATVMIAAMFVNGGNYGLTLLQLRYGGDGLVRGVVFFVTSTVMVYTIGVLIASMGRTSWRGSLKRMSRLPAVYAAILGIIVYSLNIPIPQPIMSGITVAGAGAIPVMLIILGMQIADMQREESDGFVWPAVSLRLIGGPLVGFAVASLIGLEGLNRNSMIIETSMPTAVICIILATEFGLPTSTMARIVVFSTLISPLTIAATISLLGL